MPVMRRWHVVNNLGKTLSPAAEAFRYFILERGEGVSREALPARARACGSPREGFGRRGGRGCGGAGSGRAGGSAATAAAISPQRRGRLCSRRSRIPQEDLTLTT